MMATVPKFVLPRVKRVKLNRFSLFSVQPDVEVNVPDGILCLAGANGIGKSTFLNAVAYGITGVVPSPLGRFKTVETYYEDAMRSGTEFFAGKISEDDREESSIEIDLQLGNETFGLTRGMFEPRELRRFVVHGEHSSDPIFDGLGRSPKELDQEYKARLVAKTRLKSFDQFVFLHDFILTFDERRSLLLWNDDALLQSVFLSIGVDPEKQTLADEARKQRDAKGSWGRNLNWHAYQLKQELDNLQRQIASTEATNKSLDDLKEHYQKLGVELDRKQVDVEAKRAELGDAELRRTQEMAKLSSLHDRYNEEFTTRLHRQSRIALHPIVRTSITESVCSVCGTLGPESVNSIEERIKSGHCPLCGSTVGETGSAGPDMEALKAVDQEISETKKRLATAEKAKTRLASELDRVEAELQGVRVQIQEFESDNEMALLRDVPKSEELTEKTRVKHLQWLEKKEERDKAYAERDRWQEQLVELTSELRQRYDEAQAEFVPLFRELAHLFIGFDMDIRMNYSTAFASTGLHLYVEMQGSMRRQMHQLSESQRFFLDIALRMALAQCMSDPIGKAPLFIDTPEGSLDIAYETRAGEMFARYAERGHNIMMTANINSSQLLKRMASRCGETKMRLEKMTSWAPLSDVQQEEEGAFREAYHSIEQLLSSGGDQASA